MNDIEERDAIETRSSSNAPTTEGDYITGYAIVYDEVSGLVSDRNDGRGKTFREVIAPDAFTESMKGRNIRFIFEHDEKSEYADTDSGTLTLTPDAKGVQFRAALPKYATHLREQIESGKLAGMSFGFKPTSIEWTPDGKRIVKKGQLFHISPTWNPAYKGATFEMKAAPSKHQQMKLKLRLQEKIL